MAVPSLKDSIPHSALWQACIAYSYVLLWIALSATVILYNKWILVFYGFGYPVTLTMWHMLFCSGMAAALIHSGYVTPADGMTWRIYAQAIVPIGATYALVLWLGNAAYLYLSVSFIQMIKALAPVTVFAVGSLVGTETYCHRVMFNMVVVTIGVVIASYGEVNFVWQGFFMQLAAILLEACRLIMVQVLLQRKSGLKLNPITTLYYVAPCCFLFLLLPWAALEAQPLATGVADSSIRVEAWVLLTNACVAFALNLAVFLLIGSTGALTINIAGVVKDWLLIGLSVYLFSATVSQLNLIGYGLSFAAVAWYNYQKIQAGLAATQKAEKQRAAEGDAEAQPFLKDKVREGESSPSKVMNGGNSSAAVQRHASEEP